MAIDYTAYPVVSDLTAKLLAANITLSANASTDQKQLAIDSAKNLIEYKCGRQFLPGSPGEVRYFSGNGTGQLDIDDYITLTAIEFLQVPATSTVAITDWVEVTRVPYPKTQIKILRGPANMPYGWWTAFPQGRENIKITGTWGYGANIPAGVWDAVLCMAAAEMADQARLSAQGMLTGVKDLDQDFTWSDKMIGQVAGWRDKFDDAVRTYKRPLRPVIGRNKAPLI
jgi:hypothetical protein